MPTKEDYWKVLRGKCTLPEAMKIFGCTQDKVDEVLSQVQSKDQHDASTYFSYCEMYREIAYQKLVETGDVDGNKIFSFGGDGSLRIGDIGMMGSIRYRYSGQEWEKMY